MSGGLVNPTVRLALAELESQLKDAALEYVRYRKGRDRLTELQRLHRLYSSAVHRNMARPLKRGDVRPRLAA